MARSRAAAFPAMPAGSLAAPTANIDGPTPVEVIDTAIFWPSNSTSRATVWDRPGMDTL